MRKLLSFFLLAGLLVWAGVANAQQTFTIGSVGSTPDSTYILPIGTYHCNSYTQMVYNYGQMPWAGGKDFKINSISFYYTGNTYGSGSTTNRKIVVYMKNTSQGSFVNDSNYIPVTANDRVFVGVLNISAAGWVTINLNKQFVYRNASGNHWLIAIYDSTGSYTGRYFRQYQYSSGTYQSLSYRLDQADANPEASLVGYSGYRNRYNKIPILKFGYTIDSVSTATLPYTTNFSDVNDNQKWHLKGQPSVNVARWKFYVNGGSSYMYCGAGQDDYIADDHAVTSLIERKIQLGNSDSIRVSFNCTVGGEVYTGSSPNNHWDYMSVFMVPASTDWAPADYTQTSFLGDCNDSTPQYALYFGEHGRLASVKLSGLNNRNLTATFPNPFPGQKCKLVFVWTNDDSDGDEYCVRSIKNLSVTEVNRQQEYTPQSTAQWYGYAGWANGDIPWEEHFITFRMQNVANVDTASVHFSNDVYGATYAENYVWYANNDRSAITRANINTSNHFISGSINYQLASALNAYITCMQYNPTDNKMYFITADNKLYKMDLTDPEHYTVMGQLSIDCKAFAINAQGNAYVVEAGSPGNLYRLNLNNATTTLVGATGVDVDYNQSMAFDYSTGELFWAMSDDNDANDAMYYVNTSTAEIKYIGKIGGVKVNLYSLFTPQTAGSQPQGITTASAAELSVFPNPAKDELRVNGVENGTMIMVYDMTGKLVAQQKATENTVINVSGLTKGVYVLSAGERKIKFVKE